ncbi:MAG: hypothetical protein ABI846_05195 [Rudaea sp.]
MGTYFICLNKTFAKLGDDWLPKPVVDAVVAADPELAWVNSADAVATEGAPSVKRPISWKGKPCFSYGAMWLECEDPDGATMRKLLHVAAAFNGHVFSDTGERIELRKGMFGGEKIVTIPE